MMRILLLCIGMITLLPWTVTAQLTYRQTLVVTAAATPVDLGSATRTLTVITRDQIEALPAQSVADVLRLAASIDVRARGERGIQTDFAIRGASFGQMLVLVDGVRLNDAQSGHHNGDIPVPLDMVERVEVLYGPGSSLFGADALGGTVNVITRRTAGAPSLNVELGSFRRVSGRGQAGFTHGPLSQTLAASFERSSGFIDARDFRTVAVRSRSAIGRTSNVSVSYLRKEFGARNFYGAAATGDAMSREWTNQTVIAGDHVFGQVGGWTLAGDASYRTHGDRFAFNQDTPSLANIHRSHEAIGSIISSRRFGATATVTTGAEAAGIWLRSNALGDHALHRVSGFGEWRQGITERVHLDASLRVDRYSDFGASWSPSVGVGWWAGSNLRLRASGGRAFRVPTFTERFYVDRNHAARPEVGPEASWAGELAADLFLADGWFVQAAAFGRADHDVIDWLCANTTCGTSGATERWRTFNVHHVATTGAEVTVRRMFSNGAFVHAAFTGLAVDAPAGQEISKYVLDLAPRSFTAGGALWLPGQYLIAPGVEYRRRTRSSGSSAYLLLDLRVARRFGPQFELSVIGTNLLNVEYEEVVGVRMPGAAIGVSLSVRGR
jgi:iron complex outermembrane receptor protein